MANYELGRVGLNPRGAYSDITAYNRLDCVSYNGSSYIALIPNTGVVPTNTGSWMPLAIGVRNNPQWDDPTCAGGIEGLTTYRLGETRTGGKWIDGKPIYRRVFTRTEGGSSSLASSESAYLGYAQDIDSIVHVWGCAEPNTGESSYLRSVPWSYSNSSGTGGQAINVAYERSAGKFKVWNMGFPSSGFVIAIEYTKTTDSAARYSVPHLTGNNDQGCIVDASSVNSPYFAPWKMFDGMDAGWDHMWASETNDPDPWIQIRFPHRLYDMQVTIENGSNPGYGAVAGEFLASNDGSTWVQIGSFANRPLGARGSSNHILGNETGYQWLRIHIVTRGRPNSFVDINELYIDGLIESE